MGIERAFERSAEELSFSKSHHFAVQCFCKQLYTVFHSAAALSHRTETPDTLAQLKLREAQSVEDVENWCAVDQAGANVDQAILTDICQKITQAKNPQMGQSDPLPEMRNCFPEPIIHRVQRTHLIHRHRVLLDSTNGGTRSHDFHYWFFY